MLCPNCKTENHRKQKACSNCNTKLPKGKKC